MLFLDISSRLEALAMIVIKIPLEHAATDLPPMLILVSILVDDLISPSSTMTESWKKRLSMPDTSRVTCGSDSNLPASMVHWYSPVSI